MEILFFNSSSFNHSDGWKKYTLEILFTL